jgi:hypothetical protein
MHRVLIAFGLGLALFAPFGMAVARPPTGPLALVLGPPWMDLDRIILDSGGALVGPSQARFARLAQSEAPDFAQSLMSNGAWAVGDGSLIAQLCGIT